MTRPYLAIFLAAELFAACSSPHPQPVHQLPPIADFQKCTYLLCLKRKGETQPAGIFSGLLVKIDSALYCMTTAHIIAGEDVFKKQFWPQEDLCDSLLFRYFTRSGQAKYISYPLKQGTGSPFYYFEKPDIFLFKVPIANDTPAYFICNNWIGKYDVNNGTPDSVFSFGFNGVKYLRSDEPINLDTLQPDLYKERMQFELSPLANFKMYEGMDAVTHSAFEPDTINFWISPRPVGQSGNPVFFIFNNPKERKITFGGVLLGNIAKFNDGYVVRPEVLIRRIDAIERGRQVP
jgi:hypothetical protein